MQVQLPFDQLPSPAPLAQQSRVPARHLFACYSQVSRPCNSCKPPKHQADPPTPPNPQSNLQVRPAVSAAPPQKHYQIHDGTSLLPSSTSVRQDNSKLASFQPSLRQLATIFCHSDLPGQPGPSSASQFRPTSRICSEAWLQPALCPDVH